MEKHNVRYVDCCFFLNNTACLILHAWFCMFCSHVDAFYNNFMILSVNGKNLSFFIDIFTGNNFYHVISFNFLSHSSYLLIILPVLRKQSS